MTLPSVLTELSGAGWLPLADAILKATLLLAGAGIVSLLLRRRSAAARHLVWTLALISALVLPALSLALPRWHVPLLTIASPESAVAAGPDASRSLPAEAGSYEDVEKAEAGIDGRVGPGRAGIDQLAGVGDARSGDQTGISEARSPGQSAPRPSMSAVLFLIWGFGAALVLGRLVLGLAAVGWMSRRTARTTDAPWLPLARELAAGLGVSPRIAFLRSGRASMPMAWGLFRPAVVMPDDADAWPVDRLRIVLLHELAHVKRRDCLTHVLAQVACALYWFNPLAWVAARHARTERERACDDLVLTAGTHGADYADQLLDIARVMRAGRFPGVMAGASLAMAHRSQLEGRLMAILDPTVPRSSVSRRRTAGATVLFACAVMPLASLQSWGYAADANAADFRLKPEATAADLNATGLRLNPDVRLKPEATGTPEAADFRLKPEATAADANAVDLQVKPEATAPVVRVSPPDVQVNTQVATHTLVVNRAAIRESVRQGVAGATAGAVDGVVQGIVGPAIASVMESMGTPQSNASRARGDRSPADPKLVAALTAALKDTDKDVREAALHALVQLRDPSTYEPLVQALTDAAAAVREQAAFGLSQLRDRRSVEPLIAALKDQSRDVREQVAFALGQLRDKAAVEALTSAIKDVDASVREQVVFALGQLRDVAAVEGLSAALHDEKPDVREQAAFSLGQIRDGKAVPALISALKDPNADVREQAAFALGQIRDKSAVEALVIALKDSDTDVREQAAFALSQLRDPRAIDGLTAALKDSSADVRKQAAFALGQIAR